MIYLILMMIASSALAAPQVDPSGRKIIGPDGALIDLPCEVTGQATLGDELWVSCADRVLRIGGAPVVVTPVETILDGPIDGLFEARGQIWVVTRPAVARALSAAPPGGPPPKAGLPEPEIPTTPTPTTPALPHGSQVGRVVGGEGGQVVLDIGQGAGLTMGQHIELFEVRRRNVGGVEVSVEESVAVGDITGLTDDSAVVRLGINQPPTTGLSARPTDLGLGRNSLAPPRLSGFFYEIQTRVAVGVSAPGMSVSGFGRFGYRFKIPLSLQVDAAPVQMLTNFGSQIGGSGRIAATIAFDHQLFSVGLGGGLRIDRSGAKPLLAINARIGAHDGLSLSNRTQYEVGAGGGIDLMEFRGQIPVPLRGTPSWTVARGGGGGLGGDSGFLFGDIGMRFRVADDHRGKTLQLTPTIGLFSQTVQYRDPPDFTDPEGNYYEYYTSVTGPALGLDVDGSF